MKQSTILIAAYIIMILFFCFDLKIHLENEKTERITAQKNIQKEINIQLMESRISLTNFVLNTSNSISEKQKP